MLTKDELNEMRQLAEVATEGPWTHWVDSNTVFYGLPTLNKPGQYSPADLQICQTDEFDEYLEGVDAHPIEDAAFIAAARTFVPKAIASIEQLEATAWPTQMSEALRFVLGRPNFWCGPYAQLFRQAGYTIPTKAEEEQAFVLHWLIGLVLKHGEKWSEVAQQELRDLETPEAASTN